jgi:hypothetical protein
MAIHFENFFELIIQFLKLVISKKKKILINAL